MNFSLNNPSKIIDVAEDWNLNHAAYPIRILTIPALCTYPHHFAYDAAYSNLDWHHYDLVVISDIELSSIKEIQDWTQGLGIPRWIGAAGTLYDHETLPPNMVYRPWWCYNFLKFNYPQPYTCSHKFQFEMLLGARRSHRDFMMLAFQHSDLLDQSIVNYRDFFPGACADALTPQIHGMFAQPMTWPYVSKNLDSTWEVVPDAGMNPNSISKHTPWEIYQRCSYSVVCETVGMGNGFFMSEKITKAMLAQRVFIPVATRGFVKRLREFGFEMFDNVIDYSWDNNCLDIERWQQTFEQIRHLAKQDPQSIWAQTRAQRQHNQDRLYSLRSETQQQMRELFDRTVQEIVESKA